MTDYKAMYFNLSGYVADAIDLLVKAQQLAEQRIILSDCNKEDKKK